jgi:pilus assembly protein Flp/PilA
MVGTPMRSLLRRFFEERDGQGLVEYGLLLVLIGIICLAALDSIGIEVIDLFNPLNATLETVSS